MTDLVALAGRLHTELIEIERVVERAERLVRKAHEHGDDDYLDGVALNLHGFYAGAERLFATIAREVDGAVPSGPERHRDLLLQMVAPLPGIRPAVIGRATMDRLDEYRGFRHVVRSVYTYNLKPSRVRQLMQGLGECLFALRRDLDAFRTFLTAAAGE